MIAERFEPREPRLTPSIVPPTALARFALGAQGRIALMAGVAVALATVGFMVPPTVVQSALFASSATLVLFSLALRGVILWHDRRNQHDMRVIKGFIEHDAVPSIVTGPDAELI